MLNELSIIVGQAAAEKPNWLLSFGVPVAIFGVMIFFLFRAQKKEKDQRQQMINAIKTGDKVVTAGGIHGVVTSVKDKTLMVKIADNVKIEVSKGGVGSIVDQEKEEESK